MSKAPSTLPDTLPEPTIPVIIQFSNLQEMRSDFALAGALLYLQPGGYGMFKSSIIETDAQRKLVLEGTLVPPWTAEVERAWRKAGEELHGRRLIVDLTNVTLISQDGEETLFKLMREGARFVCGCGGVLTRHVLRQLARRCTDRA